MKVVCVILGVVCGVACRTVSPHRPTPEGGRPTITLKHGTPDELATQRQLERLFDQYDLSPWLFSAAAEIDEEAIPHSHPVLTLHARHLRDDLLLLATYVHEQTHHFCQDQKEHVLGAMREVETAFPGMPVGFPDGADSKESSYEHLSCVIPLEHLGLVRLVGELNALQAFQFWATDHYRVLYKTFLENRRQILAILRKNELRPP